MNGATLLGQYVKVTIRPPQEEEDVALGRRKWRSIPMVRIVNHETKKIEEKDVVVYQLEVKDGLDQWIIYRRYKEFLALDERMAEQFGEEIMPKFPPKLTILDTISKKKAELIQERQNQLESYIQAICLTPILFQSSSARSFFEPDPSSKKSKPTPSDLILPSPPPVRIPSYIVLYIPEKPAVLPTEAIAKSESGGFFARLNKKAPELKASDFVELKSKDDFDKKKPTLEHICFLMSLVISTRDHLETIAKCEKILEQTPEASVKAKFFEEQRNSLEQSGVSLKQNSVEITKNLLGHQEIVKSQELKGYLETCEQYIVKALQWLDDTESSFVGKMVPVEKKEKEDAVVEFSEENSLPEIEQKVEMVALRLTSKRQDQVWLKKQYEALRDAKKIVKNMTEKEKITAVLSRVQALFKYLLDLITQFEREIYAS